MSRYCQVTGARPVTGHSISHSHRRSKRRWLPNLQRKRYWVPSLGRKFTLTLTPKAIKEIDRRGVDIVVAEMLTRGEKI